MDRETTKKVIVAAICIAVGALHFLIGPKYNGPFPVIISGYAIDVLLPFSLVLLSGLPKSRYLTGIVARATTIFVVAASSEMLQYFGVPVFGSTFDPFDFVAFAIGILFACAFEKLFLQKYLIIRADAQ